VSSLKKFLRSSEPARQYMLLATGCSQLRYLTKMMTVEFKINAKRNESDLLLVLLAFFPSASAVASWILVIKLCDWEYLCRIFC
jgi:hypothetical protein